MEYASLRKSKAALPQAKFPASCGDCRLFGQRQKILSLSKYCTVLTNKHHFATLKNFRDMGCENICYRKIKIPLFGLVAPNDGIFAISDFIVIIPQNGKKIKTGMLGGGAVY